MRHLASVTHEGDRFQPSCVCGWQGCWHHHQGAAFADAHVHTRYVQTVIVEPDVWRCCNGAVVTFGVGVDP
jgi:hypothetical protein